MELKLNIYNELDEVVKEYKRNSYSIRMRQLKNVLETLDIEGLAVSLTDTGSNAEFIASVGRIVMNSYETVKEIVMDIFPELTEAEYEDAHLDEVVTVIVNIVKYSFKVIGLAGGKGKN